LQIKLLFEIGQIPPAYEGYNIFGRFSPKINSILLIKFLLWDGGKDGRIVLAVKYEKVA